MTHPKNPRLPRVPLTLDVAIDVVHYEDPLWRIHTPDGRHPSAWDQLRTFGPLTMLRWEPHPTPQQDHTPVGVAYAATDYTTSFAEVFQADRAITLSAARVLSGWTPARPLDLLNLSDSDWLIHHGASASLPHTNKGTCRGWARAINDQLGDQIDGLWAPSTVTGDPIVALFQRAMSAYPKAPQFSRNLSHPAVVVLAHKAAARLGWPIR